MATNPVRVPEAVHDEVHTAARLFGATPRSSWNARGAHFARVRSLSPSSNKPERPSRSVISTRSPLICTNRLRNEPSAGRIRSQHCGARRRSALSHRGASVTRCSFVYASNPRRPSSVDRAVRRPTSHGLPRRHIFVTAFVERRSQSPRGQELTNLPVTAASVYNLHHGRWRGLTWHDEDSDVVWLLGVGWHESGSRGDAYTTLKARRRGGHPDA